jgi:hypothetical protein
MFLQRQNNQQLGLNRNISYPIHDIYGNFKEIWSSVFRFERSRVVFWQHSFVMLVWSIVFLIIWEVSV